MLRKSKLSSAVAIAIAATVSVTTLTGCIDEGSTSISRTSGSAEIITNPKGSVVGNVQDTNGNPLAGVTVGIAGQTTTTDALGNYRFANVGVTNAAGADASIGHDDLLVTVAAPTGYLGAYVRVDPNAQIDGSNANEVRENTTTLFIDGFVAQAGTAVLPALSSTVTGILRNNTTHEPIPGMLVTLDLEEVGDNGTGQNDHDQGVDHDDVDAGYQTFAYTATTNPDGSFTIFNVPADSELRIEVEGHEVNGQSYNGNTVATSHVHVNTNDEDTTANVGNLLVTPHSQIDDAAPYVISVVGVQDQQATPGQFNDDLDGTAATGSIVINFSEAMASAEVDANSVVVYDTTNAVYIVVTSATMAADNRSMTIETTSAIPEGATFDVNMLRADFQDLAGNNIDDIDGPNSTPLDDVNFDSVFTSAANGSDIYRLTLRTFRQINTSASGVTLAQLSTDATGSDDDMLVQASNAAFADVWDDGGDFQQLNASDDDDTFGGADSEERLNDLAVALGASGVTGNSTRINFTPIDASEYQITVTRDGTANVAAAASIIADTNPDGVTTNYPGGNVFEITDLNGGTSTIQLVMNSVEPGDVVEITPFDDLGYAGSPNTLVLVDNVAPTAVLQNAYGADPSQSGATTSVTFGDGGELSNGGTSVVGMPVWLLDNLVADNDGDGNPDNINAGDGSGAIQPSDNNLLFELMENNVDDVSVGGSGVPYITPNANGPYDATAFAAMNTARTGGFSMSEDVTLTGTPIFSGTNATLSGYAENMDVTRNDDNGIVNVDLINADIDDVFMLAADTGSTVDFGAGAITDTAGNVSVEATVVIRDDMPPMVVSAVYSGTSVVVTFNEAVNIDLANDTINISGVDLGLTLATMSAGNTVLTIIPEDDRAGQATGSWIDEANPAVGLDGYGDLNRAVVFFMAQYAEVLSPAYTLQGTSLTEGHAVLNTDFVEDTMGNDWIGENAGVTYATFAAIDTTGAFDVTEPTVTATGTLTSISYSFDHPLDVLSAFASCGGTVSESTGDFTINNVATDACFELNGAPVVSVNATYSGTTDILTVNLVSVAVVATDTIRWLANGAAAPATGVSGVVTGEYDSVDTTTVNLVSVTP